MEKWITFVGPFRQPKKRTLNWFVKKAEFDTAVLGDIQWHSPWRCYAFFPRPGTLYEKQCLRDIADFCEKVTQEQKVPAALAPVIASMKEGATP